LFLDPSTDATVRQEALKYLLHFAGDLHQPLHIEDAYRGGNEIHVCFGKACAHNNLHAVWDKDIPHKICGLSHSAHGDEEKQAAVEWADKLASSTTVPQDECADVQSPSKCTLKWASEANKYVCSVALKETVDWLENNDLSQEYYQEAAPVVEYLIGIAGVRLGGYMNALAAASQSGNSFLVQEFVENVEL
jgi:S1/P1 Nuclease